jgi:alkanesulfonate monooxygenase SsuD/methylene tetrahydromethanopterin reductase-like flavin-dependent oxidoreductase (luciferase family)
VNPASVPRIADHGYRLGTFLSGFEGTRRVFQAYRDHCAATGKPQPGAERFGYAALVYTGKTDEEGFEGARKLLWYLHSNKVTPEFTYPPGYLPYPVRAAGLRGQQVSSSGAPASSPIPDLTSMSVPDLIEQGLLFAGSAKSVAAQIERFHEHVGGFGHLLLMGQAGHLDHDETVRGIRRFAEDVVPVLDRVTDRVAV